MLHDGVGAILRADKEHSYSYTHYITAAPGPWPSAFTNLSGLCQCVWVGNKGLEKAELPACMAKFADKQVLDVT